MNPTSQNKEFHNEKSREFFVSVVIIFLNEEKYIQDAIESVFSQTYANWELLLVDDGSTDRSKEIAKRYAENFPKKVRYLNHTRHENKGMSASRNLGVYHAKGTHIAYLDGDDVWLPNMLKRQVAILKSYPEAVMVCAPLKLWHSWTGKNEDLHRDALYGVGSNGVHPYGDTLIRPPALLRLFLRDERYIPSSVLVKREDIELVGGYEDVFRDGYSDAVVFVKLCLGSTVFVSSECFYKYRKHSESYTYKSWHSGEDPAIRQFYLNWVGQYLLEQGVKDQEVWRAFQDAIWIQQHPRLHRIKEKLMHLGQRILPVPLSRLLGTHLR